MLVDFDSSLLIHFRINLHVLLEWLVQNEKFPKRNGAHLSMQLKRILSVDGPGQRILFVQTTVKAVRVSLANLGINQLIQRKTK